MEIGTEDSEALSPEEDLLVNSFLPVIERRLISVDDAVVFTREACRHGVARELARLLEEGQPKTPDDVIRIVMTFL